MTDADEGTSPHRGVAAAAQCGITGLETPTGGPQELPMRPAWTASPHVKRSTAQLREGRRTAVNHTGVIPMFIPTVLPTPALVAQLDRAAAF